MRYAIPVIYIDRLFADVSYSKRVFFRYSTRQALFLFDVMTQWLVMIDEISRSISGVDCFALETK